MSRQRKLIAKRAKELGIKIDSLVWKPTRKLNKLGWLLGGWWLGAKSGHWYVGYNIRQLLTDMEKNA